MLRRNPTTGMADCCARTANGHAAAALLRSVMNSRRLIAAPEAWTPNRSNFYRYTGRAEMSALGQKRTHAVQQSKSALPPIATANADSRKTSCTLYACGGGNVRFPTLIRTAMARSDRAALPDGPDRGQMKSPQARQANNGHTMRLVARWPMLGANVRFGSKAGTSACPLYPRKRR